MSSGADGAPPADGAAANRDPEERTLPHGDRAIVPQAKLIGYLLSETHPVGRAVERVPSSHGVKYVVDGTLLTPQAGEVSLRTVWIIEPGVVYPRLVTAYPAPQR